VSFPWLSSSVKLVNYNIVIDRMLFAYSSSRESTDPDSLSFEKLYLSGIPLCRTAFNRPGKAGFQIGIILALLFSQ
jgi:hypothetical protein